MKFEITQTDFSKALTTADKSILTKATLPVLSNVLISATKNKVEVLSTNLETAARVVIDCKVQVEGKTTLPGKVLSEFVSQIGEGNLVLEKLGEEVLITGVDNSARLATMPAEEFPAIPKIVGGKEIKIGAANFIECVKRVEFCAAQDETRPVLSGVLCEATDAKMTMVATDGYRLSFAETKISSGAKLKMVVPAKSISEAARIAAENLVAISNETVDILVSDNLTQVNFKIGNVEFTSRLIEGEFPNWQKIIPASFSSKAKLSKAIFTKQIRVASIFARDAGSIVRLVLDGKNLMISANTSQIGSNESKVEVLALEGKGGEIAFNFRYLLEALSIIDSEEVNFEMIESLAPGRLTGTDPKDPFFHIIMPVRLQG